MSLSYTSQGAAQLLTTAAAVPWPASPAAGGLCVLFASSNATPALADATGWTAVAASTGGGLTVQAWTRTLTGSESGTITVNAPGGTKGLAWMTQYSATSAALYVVAAACASDTDTSSTAFSLSGTLASSSAADMLVGAVTALAPSGSYSASASGVSLAQTGATVSQTGRFGARASSNTLWYAHYDAAVTAGGSGSATFSATTVGANAGGGGALLLLREGTPSTPASVTAVAMTSTAAAPAPVLAYGSTIAAVTAQASGLARAPEVEAQTVISGGGPMTATAQMVAPTVTTNEAATVTAVAATASAAAPAPTVSTGCTISAVAMTATALAPAPSVSTTAALAGTHTAITTSTTDSTSYTFSGLSIGTASTDRYLAIPVGWRSTTSGQPTVTLDGATVTKDVVSIQNTDGQYTGVLIGRIAKPTGTTAEVVVTFGATATKCGVEIRSMTGSSVVSPASTGTGVTSATATGVAGGLVVGAAFATTTTLTGVTKDATSAVTETFYLLSGQSSSTGSVTATTSGVASTAIVAYATYVGASVTAVAMTGSGGAAAPSISTGSTVAAAPATATATAPAPSVTAIRSVSVSAVPAVATGQALAPSLGGGVSITAVAATGSAQAVAPTVQTVKSVNVAATAAVATGLANAPALLSGSTIAAAVATASGRMPSLLILGGVPSATPSTRRFSFPAQIRVSFGRRSAV